MNSRKTFTSADFNGDEANLPGCPDDFQPGLVVNPKADHLELLSGSIYRLSNVLDLFWLCLDRANGSGDEHLEGALISMARLCNEARVLNRAAIEQLSRTAGSRGLAKAREPLG